MPLDDREFDAALNQWPRVGEDNLVPVLAWENHTTGQTKQLEVPGNPTDTEHMREAIDMVLGLAPDEGGSVVDSGPGYIVTDDGRGHNDVYTWGAQAQALMSRLKRQYGG